MGLPNGAAISAAGAKAADDLAAGTITETVLEVQSTTVTIDDKNIELGATGTPTDATADGGGITLKGTTDKTITWLDADDTWHYSQSINTTGDLTAGGNLTLDDGGSITEGGGTAALTIDASGEVTKIGQDVPADGEVLTWNAAGSKVLWAAGGGGGGGGHVIQDGGVSLPARTNLNFDGTYLVATDDVGNDQSDVTVSSNLQSWDGKTVPTGAVVGTSDTQTLSGKTLTEPRFVNTGFIADSSGNELIAFVVTGSAINEVTVTNADAGNSPKISATGGDPNIDIALEPKGTGAVAISAGDVVLDSGNLECMAGFMELGQIAAPGTTQIGFIMWVGHLLGMGTQL